MRDSQIWLAMGLYAFVQGNVTLNQGGMLTLLGFCWLITSAFLNYKGK